MENNLRNYEEFVAHIREETEKARQASPIEVMDVAKTSVGCVDGLTKKEEWNPPGGLVFLFNEGLLGDYMTNRAGKNGELAAHLRCGYMRVIMDIDKLAEQKLEIERASKEVERLNQKHGTQFKVIVEPQGSAAAYMKG